jgi:hypothetical protein
MSRSHQPSRFLLSGLTLTLLSALVLASMELTTVKNRIANLVSSNRQLAQAGVSVPPTPDTFNSSDWTTYTYTFPSGNHGFTLKYPSTWTPDPEHNGFPVPKDFLESRTDPRFFQPIDWASDDTSATDYYVAHDDWYLGQQGVGPKQLSQITLTDGQAASFVINSGAEFVYYLTIPGKHVVKLGLPIAGSNYGTADMAEGFQVINTAKVF